MIEHDPGVRTSMVFADMKRPMLAASTRWEYLSKHLVVWKEHVRFRLYAYILALLGIYMLFAIPVIGIACLGFSTYFYQRHVHARDRTLYSKRTIIIGH